jgi:Helix-turn-helix domain
MLGFGGHFATKSRAYSTTFSALRAARTTAMRRANATAAHPEQLPADDDPDTVLVVGAWAYAGTGWHTTADAALALAAADSAAHDARLLSRRDRPHQTGGRPMDVFLITTTEAARQLGVGRSTLYDLIRSHRLLT